MNRGRGQSSWRRFNAGAAARARHPPTDSASPAHSARRATGTEQLRALGVLPNLGMNGIESEYAAYLELRRAGGAIKWWKFEALVLRLADHTFYKPDFAVLAADDVIEIHETKGWWREDAKIKIKVAAKMYPFRFFGIQKRTKRQGGGWQIEDF